MFFNSYIKGRCLLSIFLFLLLSSCTIPTVYKIDGETMGTTYHISIFERLHSSQVNKLKSSIDSVLGLVNSHFSTYEPDSEISRINNTVTTDPIQVSTEFSDLFKLCQKIYTESNGYFDPTVAPLVELWGFGTNGVKLVPPEDSLITQTLQMVGFNKVQLDGNYLQKLIPEVKMDMSAIAKGWGVDKIADYLVSKSVYNFMIEIGGEVRCNGSNAGNPWKIGINNPTQSVGTQDVIEIVKLNNKSVATSGDYRNYFEYNGKKYSHTINPKTGFPVDHTLTSVTIISKDCATADGLATAVMAMGFNNGLNLINQIDDAEGLILEMKNSDIVFHNSEGFEQFVVN